MRWSIPGLLGAAIVFAAASADAAEPVALTLKVNGISIRGDSTQTSLGRADTIECLSFELATVRPAIGTPTYGDIKCLKRIDRASPILFQAYTQNTVVDAVFRFYRPNPAGDGTTQQYFTVEARQGHVDAVRLVLPSTIEPATASSPAYQEISISYHVISFTYASGANPTVTWSTQI